MNHEPECPLDMGHILAPDEYDKSAANCGVCKRLRAAYARGKADAMRHVRDLFGDDPE